MNYSQMHSKEFKALAEPLDYLNDFLYAGLIAKTIAEKLFKGSVLNERFLNNRTI